MIHMLSCFNLKPEMTAAEFRQSVADFTAHLERLDLIQSTDPIGRRVRDTILDTDNERDHEYFFIMSFRDRDHADRAVKHILAHKEPGDAIHKAVYANIKDQIFVCWEDI